MKKFLFGMVATASLISASIAFADAPNGGYTSLLLPKGKAAQAMASATLANRKTNIIFINETNYPIDVAITNYPNVRRHMESGDTAVFKNEQYDGYTAFDVIDRNGANLFTNFSVCNQAIATIDGGPSVYHINVSRTYCTN